MMIDEIFYHKLSANANWAVRNPSLKPV